MITLTIDGRSVSVRKGAMVLEAASAAGIAIPTLCHHAKLTPFGGCRMCIVEIKGIPRAVTSCTTPATEGMEVTTKNERLDDLRRTIVELMLSDHPNDCMTCQADGVCELQDLAYEYGVTDIRFQGERRVYDKRDGNPFVERDMEKCVMCGRCVKACDEIQGVGAIDFTYRGFKSKVCPPFERDLDCEFCGQCITVCPTGALWDKPSVGRGRVRGVRSVDTVCGYCGTGCTLTLHVKHGKVIRVTSPAGAPNGGLLCVKGRFGYDFIENPERLTTPLIRDKEGLKPATWDEAYGHIASRLHTIRDAHGADSIAGLSSARCTNEENYLFQKFMRAGVGTNNVDHCARL
jgi:predicted molibdopterin-dependent oxidoreductase YjgC